MKTRYEASPRFFSDDVKMLALYQQGLANG